MRVTLCEAGDEWGWYTRDDVFWCGTGCVVFSKISIIFVSHASTVRSGSRPYHQTQQWWKLHSRFPAFTELCPNSIFSMFFLKIVCCGMMWLYVHGDVLCLVTKSVKNLEPTNLAILSHGKQTFRWQTKRKQNFGRLGVFLFATPLEIKKRVMEIR